MTQGKIERYSRPGELQARVAAFLDYDNQERYHESLDNLTPADVYFSRGQTILNRRARIKRRTFAQRRKRHRKLAA